jgi:uncharacterized membrane-anchored protein
MDTIAKLLVTLVVLAGGGTALAAGDEAPEPKTIDRATFEASLHYRTDEIKLGDGIATLRLSPAFRYLPPDDTARLLTQGWGNPKGDGTLGMLVPAELSPLAAGSFGVVITYEQEGHVSDQDADKIDYNDLLKQMQAQTASANEERRKRGYDPIEFVGWAEAPHYDGATHKLYWAKELAFGTGTEHTLNYDIRVLGRRGVLVLTAVSGMSQIETVKRDMQDVVAFTDFNPGHTYAEFDPKIDKAAAYGLAALVAGGIAAKSGLVAKLIALLIAGKKVAFVAVVGAAAAVRKLFKRGGPGGTA